jgi:hypothetical protein
MGRQGKRVGGSAYWRIGVWGSKTAFRIGYNDQEVSTELMMLCKRRHADTPIRPYVSPSRPIFNATRAGPRPVGCLSVRRLPDSLDPYESRYGRFTASPARAALKNSQLTCGDITIICETVH